MPPYIVVANVKSAIQHLPDLSKEFTREACKNKISANIVNNPQLKSQTNMAIVKCVREKNYFYLKADKENKDVISDKEDYYEKLNH